MANEPPMQIRQLRPVAAIKIITINTWKCDGPYWQRLPLLAAQLKAEKPTIIACQECFLTTDGNADTLKYLAVELDMQYVFLPARQKERLVDGVLKNSFSGLGILSIYPVTTIAEPELPYTPGDDERKMQLAEIALSGDPLLLANIHLTHVRNAEYYRAAQAAFVAETISAYPHKYRIICGDFNAENGSSTLNAFTRMTKAADCYTLGNGTEPHVSVHGRTTQCIDHILTLPFPGTTEYPAFANAAVVLDKMDNDIYPSDHFGITTTLLTEND